MDGWSSPLVIMTGVLVVATLVPACFLFREFREQKRALQINAEHLVTSELMTLGRWIAEHSTFDEAMKKPAAELTRDGERAAIVVSGFMDQILRQCKIMGLGHEKDWVPWVKGQLETYPQVTKRITEHEDYFSSDTLKKLAKEQQQRNEGNKQEPSGRTSHT